MVNLDPLPWEFSKGEKYAINYWAANGYDVILRKRYISKDKFTIGKDGFSVDYDLPLGNPKIDYKNVMIQFEDFYALSKRLSEMSDQ